MNALPPRPLPPRNRQRGVSSIMFLLLLIPLLLAVGVAVDFARMVQFRSDLQNAVDEAALAGAAVFIDSTQSAQATAAATDYFKRAMLPVSLSVSAPTVTPNASDTINPALGSAAARTITVTATATVPTTLMSLVAPSMVSITTTAKAANPEVSANLAFPLQLSSACDGNTVYLYQVPSNSTNTGYDYSKVPAFNPTNYYEIYTSYSPNSSLGQLPNQTLPTFSVNQPLGVMLRNDTNGNVGNSNCGTPVSGANSYGAPSGASQTFYSSLLMNGQSPSELTNYTYTASVTTSNTTTQSVTTTTVTKGSSSNTTTSSSSSSSSNVTGYTINLPPSTLYPEGKTVTGASSNLPPGYDQLAMIFGVNEPGTANSACTTITSSTATGQSSTQTGAATTRKSGSTKTTTQTTTTTTPSTTVTQYSCKTQYRTSAQSTGNCSLYVQTGSGVTTSYLKGLANTSPNSVAAPAAAVDNCFNMTGGGAAYSAPSCAQLSSLASGSGSSAVAPAAVFWWDDDGGVGSNEQYYGTQTHCSQIGASSPGYGEDCQYRNMVVALQCQATGGSGTGYTSVVLTQ